MHFFIVLAVFSITSLIELSEHPNDFGNISLSIKTKPEKNQMNQKQ